MYRVIKFVLLLLAAALPAIAADVAVLQNGFTIRHERREVLGSITRLYTSSTGNSYVDIPTAQIDHFEKDTTPDPPPAVDPSAKAATSAAPAPRTLNEMVSSASDSTNIDPDLINSVIHAESNFNAHAVSPKGARGLMQLMPKTATDLGVSNSFDANANVQGGSKYLGELLQRYNYDMVKALAAYNAGPQRVDKYHGVPPYYETRAYVARIVRDFNNKKMAERKAAAAQASQKKVAVRSASKKKVVPLKQAAATAPNTARAAR